MPGFETVPCDEADIAWLIYTLEFDNDRNVYQIKLDETVYSKFDVSLNRITRPESGDKGNFVDQLQSRLDDMLEESNPPDAPIIDLMP